MTKLKLIDIILITFKSLKFLNDYLAQDRKVRNISSIVVSHTKQVYRRSKDICKLMEIKNCKILGSSTGSIVT